jgi:hypothetical protein
VRTTWNTVNPMTEPAKSFGQLLTDFAPSCSFPGGHYVLESRVSG